MTSLVHAAPFLPPPSRRRAGIALTLLVHAALFLGWQATREPPSPAASEPRGMTIQWIHLQPLPVPAPRREEARPQPVRPRTPVEPRAITLPRATLAPPPVAVPAAPAATPAPATAASSTQPAAQSAAQSADTVPPSGATAPAPSARALLENARRAAGGIDRTLRKENNPYIVAPLDSPEIRMRKGMQAAADMAPNAWYEAPKTEELVNNTGDGARRTRVISGGGTYCITERAPTTSIDMIEKHGKQRITSCPGHESPASAQEWRTARD